MMSKPRFAISPDMENNQEAAVVNILAEGRVIDRRAMVVENIREIELAGVRYYLGDTPNGAASFINRRWQVETS
jgi:hypothetical protein